ncbi:MAG: hypothetical protein QM749_08840 [Aquabacterium sp.]
MRMTRYWMTGSMALILLVAGRMPTRTDLEDEQREGQGARITMISKYQVDETMRYIERTARKSGLPVLLRTAVQQAPAEGEQAEASAEQAPAQVLVLGDTDGRTPVWQGAEHETPYLPWHVTVRQRADGRAEVVLPDASQMPPPEEIDAGTLSRLNDLSKVIERGIT